MNASTHLAPDASPFPVPDDRFWAKLDPRETPTRWHPLIAHSADVAAVLGRLLAPEAALSRRLGNTLGQPRLTEAQRAALVFLAAMHDMGKTGHGFQRKARPAGQQGNYSPSQRGHVQTLLSSVGESKALTTVIDDGILSRLSSDLDGVGWELFLTTIAHHGRPWRPDADARNNSLWQANPTCGRDPLAEIQRLIDHARRWSGIEGHPGEPFAALTPEFTHLYAGALTLADWIGSTQSAFDFAPWADSEPDRYWEQAQHLAAEACARIGAVPDTVSVAGEGLPLLRRIFPMFAGEATPTQLQEYAATMPLPPEGARLLIESETGSGKTEAALTLFARLRAAGRVDGLMFALPTRATSSAMFDRVKSALDALYPSGSRPTLALAVGGQQPRTWSSEALIVEASQTWEDEAARRAELERWATSSNKKFFAAEVVVGTLDQVLLAGLPIKHAHLRLAALSRHLLVVDEVHSYDRYMAEILSRVLDLHTSAGGMVLFMSATLSAAERRRFGGGPENTLADATKLPYPTLSVCINRDEGWRDQHLPVSAAPKRIAWSLIEEDATLRKAMAAAASGARVCILRNTVRRARETVTALREAGAGPLLWTPDPDQPGLTPAYHSRFTLPDRLYLDKAVHARFGKPFAAKPGGVILVSTQVVEQSLDVDFDLLITDLCPMDVLLQRVGRLHRHRERDLHRPEGYRSPRVCVVGPESATFTTHLKRRSLEIGWGEKRPYGNYLDGELTIRAITADPEVEIPRDNRTLVEAVYHHDPRERYRDAEAWTEYLSCAEGREMTTDQHAKTSALDYRKTYAESATDFDNAREKHLRTRLGDEMVRIELDGPVRCWYARPEDPILSIDLPQWALPHDSGFSTPLTPVSVAADESGTSFRLGGRIYRYTPGGLVWEDD